MLIHSTRSDRVSLPQWWESISECAHCAHQPWLLPQIIWEYNWEGSVEGQLNWAHSLQLLPPQVSIKLFVGNDANLPLEVCRGSKPVSSPGLSVCRLFCVLLEENQFRWRGQGEGTMGKLKTKSHWMWWVNIHLLPCKIHKGHCSLFSGWSL